ncbi:MAG: hypothetical protein JSU83_05915 [Deltaproteobacteria bacterium]|nr:MAG: hypothetical protein JSU83_05915 [Deltaproteobacteria bacterium]
MSRLIWVIGLAVLMVNPMGYAGPRTVGSGARQLPPTTSQDGAKQERSAQKKLNDLKQQQQNSKEQTIRVERSFNPRQREQFEEVRKLATRSTHKPQAINQLKSKWLELIRDIVLKDPHVDIDALVQAAMFELYQQEVQSLEKALLQVHRLNDIKRQTRKELNRARQHRQEMSVRQRDGGTIPVYRTEKIPGVKSKSLIASSENMGAYIKEMENKLNTMGGDAQLTAIDLQNALQRQQEILQTMSNISKMLHDSAVSLIRKIG